MKRSLRLLLPVCAIVAAVAADHVVGNTPLSTTRTTAAHGVTAQLVTTSDALPPIEGYDRSFTAHVTIASGGKAAVDEVLTPAKGVFLSIDGPHIDTAAGHATVTLDATLSNNAVTRYVFTQGADGGFTEKHGTKPASALLPQTTFSVLRTATQGAVSTRMTSTEAGGELTKLPTLTITRNGVSRNYATALTDKDRTLDAFEGPVITDIDGSGEPALIFSAISLGPNCCVFSELFTFDSRAGKYRRSEYNWSYYKNEPTLKRFGKDKVVTFVARDIDFSEAAGAAVAYNGIAPIQLRQFRKNAFVDVTRAYPDAILADTKEQLTELAAAKGDPFTVKAACAAYVADEWLLARRAAEADVFRTVCRSVSAADRAVIDKALNDGGYTKNL